MTDSVRIERFRLKALVGASSAAVFYIAVDLSTKDYVLLKQYSKTATYEEDVRRAHFADEVSVFQVLQTKGIVKDCQSLEADGNLFLIVDVVSGMDIFGAHLNANLLKEAMAPS